ncbi:hypothetical protein MOJ79_15865 [Calidifontimicrobium sp. SYSU G02091]|uniref:hypothetical protein n=1 Tax=Calidifontimicrobium sp. SYSU G02091 TaxID=2926421 RepID=UPI001F533C29|nr:hypothetical protein [Calidifontimicrobium sp. SYSU G02091]MCI1193314.1 hypothetical protein [Calidifontimicrobium sp. SYSU G02091]
MMRWLVLLLLLVNVALYAWNAGWLPAPLGVATDGPRDPQRLQRQVNADAVRVVTEAPLTAAAASEPASGVADAASEPAASAPGNGAAPAARTP